MKKFYLAFLLTALYMPTFVTAQETVAQTAKPNLDSNAPKPPVYRPGDEISGKVMGEPDYNFDVTVDENGQIVLPFSPTPLVAQCKTEGELKADITKLLSRDLKNPQWSLRTTKRARPVVTVFGEVREVSKIELTRKATLLEMLALAGGASDDGGGVIQVYRPAKVACQADEASAWRAESGGPDEVPFRTYKLSEVSAGRSESNPVIIPGDVIHVPKALPAYVVGEVRSPQGVLLKREGTTVFQAINMVGGVNREAKTKDIKIYRRQNGANKPEVIPVNYDLIRTGKQNDVLLEPYDVVEVDKAKKSIALTIAEFALGAGRSIITSAANQTGVRVVY